MGPLVWWICRVLSELLGLLFKPPPFGPGSGAGGGEPGPFITGGAGGEPGPFVTGGAGGGPGPFLPDGPGCGAGTFGGRWR